MLLNDMEILATKNCSLDSLLGGGISSNNITEFCGSSNTGKTQIIFQILTNSQLPKVRGGIEGKILHIDTNGEFSPKRIVQMCGSKQINPDHSLKNILVLKTLDEKHLIEVLDKLKLVIEDEHIKMITIDSLTLPFFGMIYGDKDMRILLIEMYEKLISLAEQFPSLIIVYTSPIVPKNRMPKCMLHEKILRINLIHNGGQHRTAKIQHPKASPIEIDFYITEDGLSDKGLDYYDPPIYIN